MKKLQLYLAALILSCGAISCGDAGDGENVETTEIGPGNEADSPKDTAVLVEDPNNTLDANPVNDTTVNPQQAAH
jgi:hypothetical protein